jgi:purine-nucleoside/S-methyl-5'-thioadenosine phosphorylase / adenosine deaminase
MRIHQYELLSDQPRLKHAVLTRHGGVSQGAFASLNLGFSVGDIEESVKENHARVKALLGVDRLYTADQCHGKEIAEVKPGVEKTSADILTTSHLNCPLLIKHADCQAAIFYDPVGHAVSAVHSGWRGSALNVYAETIRFMKGRYGSKPENLLVCISPSLGPDSSEFIHYRKELPVPFWEFQVKPSYFDFWQISRAQLQECGVLLHHIEVAEKDTFTDDDFFSYRRSKITGRNGTVVYLI